MDDPDLNKREGGRTVGHLQWLDDGAMAGIGPSSLEFIDTVTPGIIEEKEGRGR
jgi:hypothetical protein